MEKTGLRKFLSDYSIWAFAFGYFACYIPYSLMTKVMSKGLLPSLGGVSLDGFAILPVVSVATFLTMILVISLLGWWKYATHSTVFGLSLPHPTKWMFLSGLFTSLIIGTTTLAYTFESVSIVLAMLLLRGGVLIIGPIVDAGTKRKVRWFSWAGFAGACLALLLNARDAKSFHLPLALGLVRIVRRLTCNSRQRTASLGRHSFQSPSVSASRNGRAVAFRRNSRLTGSIIPPSFTDAASDCPATCY